ncbi:DUF3185 family protein [Sulfurimonas lithotrophica]|uniref:DUF3185 family protein n=1 Tax=Sulfurimonas lithotrophica TaxID=2590022 RepID=A0A5P8P116_9BACT|nr:DUF3185 family protein [Sulfurimonas lithotrophica]QFR49354.1 DUF3185 family protein [Sulfurimonas lithotrophica]
MKKNKMFFALALIVIAIGIAYTGYSESKGAISVVSNAINGRPTDSVMIKYVAAAVIALGGLFLLKK